MKPTSRAFKARRLVSRGFGLAQDRDGAAMVEFAIAILPVLMMFFGTVQWSVNAYLHLIVKHAAYTIARCEAVEHPGMPDSGTDTVDCLNTDPTSTSVIGTLFAHVSGVSSGDFDIRTTTLAGQYAQTPDTVQVTLNYKCSIPLGNVIACSSSGGGGAYTQPLVSTASFPNQGSAYQPIWGY